MTFIARLRTRFAELVAAGVVGALAASLLAPTAQAQTAVSGAVVADTRWTAANSPYVVNGEVAVQGGATLSIDPGVTVYMAANARLTIQAGSVRAIGSASNPIRVLSDKSRQGLAAAPGDWNQWVIGSGSTNTRLEQVVFEHGKGLVINGSSPVLNYVDIRNQQGAAISIDLLASPTGVGNRASGNALNGIAVPAGDLAGTVRWGLRGIPYIVTSGTVSVGASPVIQSVTPSTVEQGQTLTLTVSGARLDGLSTASFDQTGLTLTPFTGGSGAQLFLQLKVDSAVPTGAAGLRLQVDAGEVLFANAITVTPPMPAVTSIDPPSVQAGQGATELTLSGRNFTASSEVLFNSASVPTVYVSATQLRATLPNQSVAGSLAAQVRTPDAARPGQYLLSNSVALSVQAPIPPTVAIEPAPIALPPDGNAREITIRLSKADSHDNTLNLSISDPSKATVSPATLVILAGQTTAKITIVPLATGTVSLIAESATLQRVSVPLFITVDFRGANTAYAAPVGVTVQSNAGAGTRQLSALNANVGVAVGAVLQQVSPAAWPVGSNPTVAVRGVGIPSGAQVTVVPSTGTTLSALTVNGDGTELKLTVNTAADAPVGPRKLVVRDAAGNDIVFADPARSTVQLTTGNPVIESIEPIFGVRGTTLKLLVRGRHLQQGRLSVLPDAGIRVDAAPVISADGTSLTAFVDIAADAATGDRLIQVTTPSGSTVASLSSPNTFTVVSAARDPVTPIASGLVGVVVGNIEPSHPAIQLQPSSVLVGVVMGSVINDVSPHIGVVGTEVPVVVRGIGLQGVTSVGLVPATGASIGVTSVNEAGTEMRFTISVDASAPLGLRRFTLTAGDNPIGFLRPGDGSFLISAPVPELIAVDPQVLLAGQGLVKVTVRGRNFANLANVRLEPAEGITVTGPFETNADGSLLSFGVTVATGATSGARTVVITTAAGDSALELRAGNMVRIANQVGATYANLLTLPVGVVVGNTTPVPQRVDGSLASTAVGVVVGSSTPAPQRIDGTTASTNVGVVVGAVAQSMSPNGWLQGASGSITVAGRGLDSVTSVTVIPATGLLLGSPVSVEDGGQLSVTVSVAPDAPQVLRQLRLSTASGSDVSFLDLSSSTFGIGSLPTMTSVSPIIFQQGKGVTLTVRGSNLKGVTRVTFAPGSGLRAAAQINWSQDALGEMLTVAVTVDAGATLGNRVVRLEVPGGSTPATATPANTINVVAPQ